MPVALGLETLESRLAAGVIIDFHYAADADVFFSDPVRKQALEAAGQDTGDHLADNRTVNVTIHAGSLPPGQNAVGGNGTITFSSDSGNWESVDLQSVAEHELGHVLGIGVSSRWFSLIQGGEFTGHHAEDVYGGPVPVQSGGFHWREDVPGLMNPFLSPGEVERWTDLDLAALQDLGWHLAGEAVPPAEPASPVSPTMPVDGHQGGASAPARLPVEVEPIRDRAGFTGWWRAQNREGSWVFPYGLRGWGAAADVFGHALAVYNPASRLLALREDPSPGWPDVIVRVR